MEIIKHSIVGTFCTNKSDLLESLIFATKKWNDQTKNNKSLKLKEEWDNFISNEYPHIKKQIKDNDKNSSTFFNSGYDFGIWKDKDYNFSDLAQKVLKRKITPQDYLDIFVLNYVIKIGNKSYNPLICLLDYLTNNNYDYQSFEIKYKEINNAMGNASSNSNNSYINKQLHLLWKETSYFSNSETILKLKNNPQKLLDKCNRKYHDQPVEKFLSDIKNQTEKSIYLTTEFSADGFDPPKIQSSPENNTNQDFRQKIYYGAPGTGKSYKLDQDKKEIDPETTLRITFHPSYSYSNFVGVYKPIKTEENKNKMVFDFIPGPLINILIKAYEEQERNHLLIIEEINRANVSEVFGDFFQLIERNQEWESQYGISVSEDLKTYLNEKHKELNLEVDDLKFPSNLYIWATMNSSDQGTFPLDTAFKRRWNFEYIGIDDNKDNVNILFKLPADKESTDWNDFRESINEILLDINSTINEDKLLGPFFIGGNLNGNDAEDNTEIIKNKVVPYLYEDVLKYLGREAINKIFNSKLKNLSQIISEFDKEKEKNNKKDKNNPKIAKFTDIFSDELNKKINSIKAQKKTNNK